MQGIKNKLFIIIVIMLFIPSSTLFSYILKITDYMIMLIVVTILCMVVLLYLAHKLKNPFKRPTFFQNILEVTIEYLDKNVLSVVLGN